MVGLGIPKEQYYQVLIQQILSKLSEKKSKIRLSSTFILTYQKIVVDFIQVGYGIKNEWMNKLILRKVHNYREISIFWSWLLFIVLDSFSKQKVKSTKLLDNFQISQTQTVLLFYIQVVPKICVNEILMTLMNNLTILSPIPLLWMKPAIWF